MRRISLFLILTIAALISLVAVVVVGYSVLASTASPYPNDWMGQMMGGGNMMGGTGGTQAQTQTSAAPYFGVAFVVLVAVALVGIGGLIYFIAFPQIKITHPISQPVLNTAGTGASEVSAAAITPLASVVKTLNKDELKVVEVLKAHDGNYLQKYIRKDAGLSRLQTHRIVARLAERGIVTLEKTGNTNSVLLADWLK